MSRVKDSSIQELQRTHLEGLRSLERLQNVVTHLHFEGKPYLGKNLKRGHELLTFFQETLNPCFERENGIVFPFLKMHIPKLEPILEIFEKEHFEFKVYQKSFQGALREMGHAVSHEARLSALRNIRKVGSCIIFLLNNHLKGKLEIMDSAILHELRPEEIEELEQALSEPALHWN